MKLAKMAILFAAGTLGTTAAAKEHLIEVSWSPAGDYKTDLRIAPGKFKELCMPLKKGERVEWSFSSPVDTAFNIHYHVGADVSFPAKVDGIRAGHGTLDVSVDQHYCWMWKAGSEAAPLTAGLKRHQKPQ